MKKFLYTLVALSALLALVRCEADPMPPIYFPTDYSKLASYSSTSYPQDDDTWVIDEATATTADFAGLNEAIQTVDRNEPSRKITLEFTTLEAIPNSAISASNTLVGVVATQATSIGDSAFLNCTNLATLDFPLAAVLGNYAFGGCTSLTDIEFPSVTSIENGAFCYCTALTTIDFPSATTIGSCAFFDCANITTMSLATADDVQLTNLNNYSFYNTTTTNIALNLGGANSEYVDANTLTVGDLSAEFKEIYLDGILQEEQVIIPEMIYVEGGTFEMGSTDGDSDEEPVHTVTVSSFYIGKYEVTQAEWEAVMGSNPSYSSGDTKPVEKVTWYDCVAFCNAKSVAEGLEACYEIDGTAVTLLSGKSGYRLPTEAEWEYAARGGNQSNGYIYSGSDNIEDVAWYNGNASSTTHVVGTKQPNELGIYDMSGNVSEWCWDWYGSYDSTSQTDPTGATIGSYRVYRGGSYYNSASYCRSSNRYYNSPTFSDIHLGLRLVSCP